MSFGEYKTSFGEYKTMLFGESKTCHLGTKNMPFTDTLQCCILHLSESVTVERPFKTFILLYSTLLRSRVCTVVDLALAVTSESPDTHFTGVLVAADRPVLMSPGRT